MSTTCRTPTRTIAHTPFALSILLLLLLASPGLAGIRLLKVGVHENTPIVFQGEKE